MAEFIIDFGGLVAPSAASASPLPIGNARPNERFEDHLGQAARPPRESSQEPQRERSPNSAPVTDSATQRNANSNRTEPARAPENVDGPHASDDTIAKIPVDESSEKEREPGDISAEEAATVVAPNDNPTPNKPSAKRRAANSDETLVEKVTATKAKSKAKLKQGKPGDDERIERAAVDAKTNKKAKADQTSDTKAAVAKPLNNPAGVEQPVGDVAKEAAQSEVDVPADDGGKPSHASTEHSAGIEISAAQAKSPEAATQKATAVAPQVAAAAQAVAAAEPTDPANPSSGTRRTRANKTGEPPSPAQAREVPDQKTNQSSTPSTPAAAAKVTAQLAAAVEPVNKDQATVDATAKPSNEKTEPRVGPAPTLLSARQDKAHEPSGRPEGLTETERVRFVQRVARAFHSIGDEGGEVRLRLSPPELGSLRLELTVREGVLTARLETETATARSLLLDNLPTLRDRLAEQNIKVERFDVDVRDENRDRSGEQFAGQPGDPQQGQRQRPKSSEPPNAQARAERTSRSASKRDGTSELNVVI